jgi:hypothetical protein
MDEILSIFRKAGYDPKYTIHHGVVFFDTKGDSLSPEIREELWELGVAYNKTSETFYYDHE